MYQKGLIVITVILYLSGIISIPAEIWKLGDQGQDLMKIQKFMIDMGYDLNIAGIFDCDTEGVVKDFQLNNGLEVDGIVGENTSKEMGNTIEDIYYIVKDGDTLSEIALEYNTTVKSIKNKNNLKSDFITMGQKLRLNGNTNQFFQLCRGNFIWPVVDIISSPYGCRINPITKKEEFHEGIDIAVPIGTSIRAAASGTVIESSYIKGFGQTVIIDHGYGIKTLYGHNSRLLVEEGSKVSIGQIISLSGETGMSTGPHLHFGIYKYQKAVDPIKYLP